MYKLQVIVGSTRDGRNADAVCRWLLPVATARGDFEIEVLDLRNWRLPFFQETIASVGDFANPTYSDPVVKRWNDKISEADAYVIVTPEYNRSLPGELKNAIDTVFFSYSFRRKPVAVVSYSLGPTAGVCAVQHLCQIMVEMEAVPVRTPTLVPLVSAAFDDAGLPVNPVLGVTLSVMLDDLAWFAEALKRARDQGGAPPAALRIRAASPHR